MLVGVTFFLLALTSDPPPTPTPKQEQENPLPEVPVTVHVVRSKAVELRATSPDRVRCGTLPLQLAHDPDPPVPQKLPPGSRIAGSGHTLGLLLPTDKGLSLSLFRRGREVGRYWLKLPARDDLDFDSVPPLTLGEEGRYVALRGGKGFAVYADGTLTTVVDEEATNASVAFRAWEVMWCPEPSLKPGSWRPGIAPSKLLKEGEEPPLWLRAELDGSNRQVLGRVDVSRLDPEFPEPSDWAMGIATRRDGKLWLVGLGSTEVWLASPGGRILRRELLPVRLRTAAEDGKAVKEFEDELLRESRSRPRSATAPQPRSVLAFGILAPFVVNKVYARENDLVVTTLDDTQPANAIILVPADGSEPRCWTVPSEGGFLGAVTSEELWFLKKDPENEGQELRYMLWEELLAFGKEPEEAKAPATTPRN